MHLLHLLQNKKLRCSINCQCGRPLSCLMTLPGNSIQSAFLEQVRKRLSDNVSFADELAEILNISRDSAYRRIRGETILSLDEAKTLHNRFGISLDVLFSDTSEMVTFHRRVVNLKDYTLEKWANSIQKNLEFLRTFEQYEFIFSARDIPVFHYFRIPELSAFKLFFWMKTLIGYPDLEHKMFAPEAVPKGLLAAVEKMWTTYSSLASTEIWNEEAVYDTLRQIEFYEECGFFSHPGQAASLCDHLINLLGLVQSEASSGVKSEGGAFNLYNNEILIADNTVFARMGTERRSVYVNQNALNLLLTFQEPFCEQTEVYLQNLIKKSTLISKTGERERSQFFNKMTTRILMFKERLGQTGNR